MEIEWINHAAFLASEGDVGLLCDPWIEGFVFDNSWALISPTKFGYEDFSRVTHIWISHEHPDHFSPPTLKRIPPEIRRRITVLFQKTEDKRVVKFCRTLGFQAVEELPAGRWTELGEHMSVLCRNAGRGDSWLAIKTREHTILNLNDCIYGSQAELSSILDELRNVDILITQFSYASWWGNANEPEKWVEAAHDTLVKIEREIGVFQPKQTILSASFVYFCHAENVYMNRHINHVEHACEWLRGNGTSAVVALYPGDVWKAGTAWDNESALRHYRQDYETALQSPIQVTTSSVSLEELVRAARSFTRTLRRKNSRLLLMRLSSALIGVEDLGVIARLGLNGLQKVEGQRSAACDIMISSSALLYCFKFPWGGETLFINGRFRVPEGGDYYKFSRWFSIALANSRCTYYDRSYYLSHVAEKLRHLLSAARD